MFDPANLKLHRKHSSTQSTHLQSVKSLQSQRTFSKVQESFSNVNTYLTTSLQDRVSFIASCEPILQTILQLSSEGSLFLSFSGKILFCNQKGASFLGMEAQDLLLQPFWKYFSDDLLGFSMKEALCFGIAKNKTLKRLNNKELEVITQFFYKEEKEHCGLIILLKDLSDQQRLKNASIQDEKLKELGSLVAVVAHELRNPLGGMRGYASLLERDLADSPHLLHMIHMILDGMKSLEAKVHALLHYAKPVTANLEPQDLGFLLKKVCSFVQIDPTFPPGIHMEIHAPEKKLLACVDEELLKSCLLNLAYNAIQAMPQGGLLTFSLLSLNQRASIVISDTGVGIRDEDVENLFSPFFTTKTNGTGLGLVEAKKIAKAHGGDLEVRSQKGRGSTFTLQLPLYTL